MRIASGLIALVLAGCGAKVTPTAAPTPPPDATLNAAPPLRDESPAPPQTDPVPFLAPPS
jgi:hypothetical protein